MQRRAAAMYFAFFIIVGAGAYGLIATTSAPHVSLDGPTHASGDTVTLEGRTYTITEIKTKSSGGGGHGGGGGSTSVTGSMKWTNESGELQATLKNGSTVPVTAVTWDDQEARHTASLEAGDTIPYKGSQYRASINTSASTLVLTNTTNSSQSTSLAVGDTVPFRGYGATITEISDGAATLVYGGPYRVDIPNVTNMKNVSTPPNMSFVETRNVTALAENDSALYDEVVTIDGIRYVTYKENETNVPVMEYFGPLETKTFEVGDTIRYKGNETTLESLSVDAATLTWTGSVTNTVELSEGGTITVKGTTYLVHFPDNSSVQILPESEYGTTYATQKERIKSFEQRTLGLWGVAELSLIAAIVVLSTAFLPVRG